MKRRIAILLLIALLLGSIPAAALPVIFGGRRAVRLSLLLAKPVIRVDASRKLLPRIKPAKAVVDLEWAVEEGDDCLKVDQEGEITGLKPGNAVVRATDKLTGLVARRRVSVRPVAAKSLSLNRNRMMLTVGESFESLAVSFNPANTTDKTVTWSFNPKVVRVTVDEATGMATVTGVAVGTTIVVARSKNGKRVGCNVRVVDEREIFTISAVGDVLLGGDPRPEKVMQNALGRNSYEAFHRLAEPNTGYCFANVKRVLKEDDVTIANLECVLTNRPDRLPMSNKSHVLVGRADLGTAILRDAGVEMVTLGNNHTMDLGSAGLEDTRIALQRSGIVYGDHINDGIYLVERNGFKLKVGLLGYQTPLSGDSSMASIKRRIARMKRAGCNVVIAYFHWCNTKEWTSRNYPQDRAMAQAAINAGADLVLGAHRHLPAGIESYKNRYIVHDLSNFVVGLKHQRDNASLIFQWKVSVDKKGVKYDEGISVIPCTTTTSSETYPATDGFGEEGARVNNWQPAILAGAEGQALIDRIQAMSNVHVPMGTVD
ncbi:MAG: CapA family protein [Bacillota bacterium]|nr:CapA family protein [Bacillota bacterium]